MHYCTLNLIISGRNVILIFVVKLTYKNLYTGIGALSIESGHVRESRKEKIRWRQWKFDVTVKHYSATTGHSI